MSSTSREHDLQLVLLSEDDVEAVQDLYTRCAGYFILQDGEVADRSDAVEIFLDIPPEKTLGDLTVFGSNGDRGLNALAAILRDYPSEGVWYLPFMVIDPNYRRRGLGRAFYTKLERWAAERGAREFRLVALEDNLGGERFWRSLSFDELRRVGPHEFKKKQHRRIEFRRTVATGD